MTARNLGFNSNALVSINEDGNYTFQCGDTLYEVDDEGYYRHRGIESNCFWTEWEGGYAD